MLKDQQEQQEQRTRTEPDQDQDQDQDQNQDQDRSRTRTTTRVRNPIYLPRRHSRCLKPCNRRRRKLRKKFRKKKPGQLCLSDPGKTGKKSSIDMKRIILLILTALSVVQTSAQGQFTVEAPNVVATGERFRLVFTATDLPHETFNPPGIDGLLVLAGPTTSTMNRMEYINGRRTQSRSVGYLHSGSRGRAGTVLGKRPSFRTTLPTRLNRSVEVIRGTAGPAPQGRKKRLWQQPAFPMRMFFSD